MLLVNTRSWKSRFFFFGGGQDFENVMREGAWYVSHTGIQNYGPCTLVCLSILYHIFLIIKLLPSCFGLLMLWYFYFIYFVLRTIFQLIKCYMTSPIFILLIFNFQYVGLCLLYERKLIVWTRPELGHSIAEFQKCQVHPCLCEYTNIYHHYLLLETNWTINLMLSWALSWKSLEMFLFGHFKTLYPPYCCLSDGCFGWLTLVTIL